MLAALSPALPAAPLVRAADELSAPRTAGWQNRTRSWFRPAAGVADCPLDAPVILLKMARAGSSDIVQNLGHALPSCRWDAELLHETNEALNADDYNKCNDGALAEEYRLFREAIGERSIISHNPVSTAGGRVGKVGQCAPDARPRLCLSPCAAIPFRGSFAHASACWLPGGRLLLICCREAERRPAGRAPAPRGASQGGRAEARDHFCVDPAQCASRGRLGALDVCERHSALGRRHAEQHTLPAVGRARPRDCARRGPLAVQHAAALGGCRATRQPQARHFI
jgi:hypothetical protein